MDVDKSALPVTSAPCDPRNISSRVWVLKQNPCWRMVYEGYRLTAGPGFKRSVAHIFKEAMTQRAHVHLCCSAAIQQVYCKSDNLRVSKFIKIWEASETSSEIPRLGRAFDWRPHDTWLASALLSCERHAECRSKAEVKRWTTTGRDTLRPPTSLDVWHVAHFTLMLLDWCPDSYICIVSSFFPLVSSFLLAALQLSSLYSYIMWYFIYYSTFLSYFPNFFYF